MCGRQKFSFHFESTTKRERESDRERATVPSGVTGGVEGKEEKEEQARAGGRVGPLGERDRRGRNSEKEIVRKGRKIKIPGTTGK